MLENHELLVVVTTPEGKVYNHRSYSVSADAVDGGITILPNHAPIMLPLKIGALRVKRFLEDSPTDYIAIGGGIMEVRDNVVTVIANVAERARDIDVDRAEQAREKAEAILQDQTRTKSEAERARIALNKAINRIGVSKHRRLPRRK